MITKAELEKAKQLGNSIRHGRFSKDADIIDASVMLRELAEKLDNFGKQELPLTFTTVSVKGTSLVYTTESTSPEEGDKVEEIDFMDWNVAGNLAQKYDLFPHKNFEGNWCCHDVITYDSPQETIARAFVHYHRRNEL